MTDSRPIYIRRSHKNEETPYHLLLLADETKEAIDKYLYDGELYVAKHEDKLVAVFVLETTGKDTIEIKNIAVTKELQGNGIGTRLLEFILDNARSRGFKFLIVGTCDQCFKEIAFYKKSGFRISAVRQNFYAENYKQPIYENGVPVINMIVLSMNV